MAFKCAHCRSASVQAMSNYRFCLDCGKRTNEDGTPVQPADS